MSLNESNGDEKNAIAQTQARKNIIRTSDRKNFKQCRRQWDIGSKIRQNWEPDSEAKVLTFGTAIHAALEVWYEPKTWNTVPKHAMQAIALAAFLENYPVPAKASDDVYADWQTSIELGKTMLTDYFAMSVAKDDFTPVLVEIEFEVPVVLPVKYPANYLPDDFSLDISTNYIFYKGAPVIYQGRIDMIVKDNYDRYWIWDHKTAANLGRVDFLEMDEQITSYMWAIQQQLNIKIDGFVYNELAKQSPHAPAVVYKTKKNPQGKLSTDKNQLTSYALYMQAIEDNRFNPADYVEFLQYIQDNPKQFTRRTTIQRSQQELKILGDNIALEAIDMLNNPSTYPSPAKFTCDYCAYRTPCLAMMEGSDPNWILEDAFHQRVAKTE